MIVYEALNRLEEEWGQTKAHPLYTRPGHFTIHPGGITGPGSITVAHAPNEHVAIEELMDACRIYALAIVGWCGV